jgi:hypothetical protein
MCRWVRRKDSASRILNNMSLLFDVPCLTIKPSKKPTYMNQDYWDARNKVSITLAQYVKWVNAKWEGGKVMSGSYSKKVECGTCESSEITAHISTNKTHDESYNRLNKVVKNNLTCEGEPRDGFNDIPSRYGKIPEADLMKMRYNVCYGNEATAVFLTKYNRTNDPGGNYCSPDENAPSAEESCAPGVANVDSRSINTTTCGNCGSGKKTCVWCSYNVRFCSSIYIEILGGWYDIETKKVFPDIAFGGSYPRYNWVGYTLKDSENTGPQGKHRTSTNVKVDGISIPCGTDWSTFGDSGSINSTLTWTVRIRDL